jgi:small-conductance mechanosensitive channel
LRLSALLLLKTMVLLLLALWAAVALSDFLDKRVHGVSDLTPSLQVLIGKFVRLALITLAVLVVLSSAGIDFSALAIFSGAVGVGVGLGLQKIVSNFVSGIILLSDKSIKPGDVITVGDSYGWVSAMNARCVSVATRDGREVLIPNEDLVTEKVINWSYTKDDIRLDVPFSVDVDNDPHHVRRVALAAIAMVPRVIDKPAPVCHFISFSAKSLDFILRFWIDDPAAGVTNIKGAVTIALWDFLRKEQIAIVSPIQDVRLRDQAHVALDPTQRDGARDDSPRND